MSEKRNTYQKRMILEALCEMKNHPTAYMVFERLQEKGTNISKSTVYRNLSEAAQEGVIMKLSITDSDVRFDGNIMPHYHVRCRECDCVFDSKIPYQRQLDELAQETDKAVITNHMIEFSGICEECQKNKK